MELSEFTPPVRQSLTDEQISQHLGAATADEAGMLSAMEFLEQQTKLRDLDNQVTAAWISKMQASDDPRAAIALQNLERAKQGLELLDLPTPVEVSSPISEPRVEAVLESFGSAEESAEVFEEANSDTEEGTSTPNVRGFRLVSAANWTIGVGILAPAVAAGVAAAAGLNFVTSILAGLVGVLVGVKVNVLALITARRTKRGLAVASRATFGVFGAIIPGVLLLLAGLTNLSSVAFAGEKYLNNTIIGLPDFNNQLVSIGDFSVTVGAVAAVVLVLIASIAAIFGGAFARWFKISIGAVLLSGFLTFAVFTISGIDYLNLAGVFQLEQFLIVAPAFALLVSVFTYALDGESLAAASWGAKLRTLTWPIFIFGFLLPLLSYGHIAALLNGHDYQSVEEVIQTLLSSGNTISSTILVDLSILAIVGLLFMGISKLIEALKTLGTNHIGYGSAIIVAIVFVLGVTLVAIFSADALAFSMNLTALFLVPAAAWIGSLLTETVMRRGKYHDASLTRGYGFYGSFNWVAIIGYVLAVSAGLSVAKPISGFAWLGFLSSSVGFSVPIVIAAWITMGLSVLFTLVTGFPRIFRQQRETKSVEDRRFDLVDVVAL